MVQPQRQPQQPPPRRARPPLLLLRPQPLPPPEPEVAAAPQRTPRQVVAAWTREALDSAQELSVSALASELGARLEGDTAALLTFALPGITQVVRDVVAATRGYNVAGNRIMTSTAWQQRQAARPSRWETWFEHAGDRHIALPLMHASDLLQAADERELQATTQRRVAQLWRQMAMRMKPGQQVKDRFSVLELDDLADLVWGTDDPTLN